jgi:hypothetical protein
LKFNGDVGAEFFEVHTNVKNRHACRQSCLAIGKC